ncbi:MAG: hypothetical protein Q8O46_02615 [bacterium]|nr:hypothetical protein [bacterium]
MCPYTSSAAKLGDLFSYVTCIIAKTIIPLIFALAVVMFLWGVVQYVINDGKEEKKEDGKKFMVWGIIALTVMIGVWGLVGILGRTFGLNTTVLPWVTPPGSSSSSTSSSSDPGCTGPFCSE